MESITDRITAAIADRYRIERHLGEGGMATVYLAEDLKHHRKVAVKVLRPELAAVLGADRFVQEITTTAGLQHPHILPLFDSGQTAADSGQFLYYVMPYVEGETLRDKLNRDTQLGIDEAVRITTEVADALDYAHRHGVIHRDIKPENILLHDGRPMVADFGIALAVSAAAGGRMTETGLSLGTPHYMSPEQATADKHLSNRSDIYSLGCMLYEMLTGEPPHTGASAQAIIMKIVTEQARSVTTLRKSVPPHIAAATAQALEKLPADRFETARAFADALKNPAFSTATTSARTVGAASAARPVPAVRQYAIGGGAVAVIALALWGMTRNGPAPIDAVVRYRLPVTMEASLGNDFGSQVAISPDGRRIVFVSAVDGTQRLWMQERDKFDAVPMEGTEQAHQPAFAPDGNRIAFVTWDRKLKIVSLGGAPPLTLADSGFVRGGVAWSDDGFIYASAGASQTGTALRGLWRVPATGGGPELVTTLDSARGELSHRYPVVLPGGRGIAFEIARGALYDATTAEIGVVDLRTGRHRSLMLGTFAVWSPTGHLLIVRADGALVALPFDPRRLEATGQPVPLLDGVEIDDLGTADIALSPDGTLVYQSVSANKRGWHAGWATRDGRFTPIDGDWTGRLRAPALSPDGTRLAMTVLERESRIWVRELERGVFAPLTFEGRLNVRPEWTHDGRSIAYISDATSTADAFVRRSDGSGAGQLLVRLPVPAQEIEWARDGSRVVLRGGSSPRGDLYSFRPGVDTAATLLFESAYDESGPAISPDGRWLAYSSTDAGQPQVFVRPLPDASSARWQVSTNGGTEPLWSRNGRELFYRDGENRLVSVAVTQGPTFSYATRTVLFSMHGTAPADAGHRMYDVSPDGSRFLIIRAINGDDARVDLVVVDNFLAEIRQKVAAR